MIDIKLVEAAEYIEHPLVRVVVLMLAAYAGYRVAHMMGY